MMTSIVQESTATIQPTPSSSPLPTTSAPARTGRMATMTMIIPPHVLIVGKKSALNYIAPALFRIGTFGELVVKAKGSMSIVTAVNVAEMVKKDVAGLETRSISIGTEEIIIEGMPRRVSYIEIHLANNNNNSKPEASTVVVAKVEAPATTALAVKEEEIAAVQPQDKLADAASTAKKIRAKAKKSTAGKKKKATTAAATARKKQQQQQPADA